MFHVSTKKEEERKSFLGRRSPPISMRERKKGWKRGVCRSEEAEVEINSRLKKMKRRQSDPSRTRK
jgi:hypothetical protein